VRPPHWVGGCRRRSQRARRADGAGRPARRRVLIREAPRADAEGDAEEERAVGGTDVVPRPILAGGMREQLFEELRERSARTGPVIPTAGGRCERPRIGDPLSSTKKREATHAK
jgi:hypothetical protein